MRLTISASITDKNVQEALEKYKEEGKNISELIQNLLKSYFFDGNGDQVKLSELESMINNLKNKMNNLINLFDSLSNQLSSLLNEVQSLRQKIEEEKKKEDKFSKDLIEKIKSNDYFDLTEFLRSPREENIRTIKLRIAVFAKNYKIPLTKAEELFKDVYPELEKYI